MKQYEEQTVSRRSLLKKGAVATAAAVGAVSLVGTKAVEASPTAVLTETDTPANAQTTLHGVNSTSAYTGSTILRVDATTLTGTANISALAAFGTAGAAGLSGTGGPFGGPGVLATGGGAGNPGIPGPGVQAFGNGPGVGVSGNGGPQNGDGVQGNGGGTAGNGVRGDANGSSADAVGVLGLASYGLGGKFFGGRAAVQMPPNPFAPTRAAHQVGDMDVAAGGVLLLWVVAGNPGTFVPLQPGGLGKSHFNAVSTSQYFLNSDGASWKDVDATALILTIKPLFNCQAVLSANADLWTTIAGFNQDIGIAISGGAYPTVAGQPEAWKESGGSAGTFSPNAAFLETTKPLWAGTTYTIKLVWKSNRAMPATAPGGGPSLLAAGAGPIPAGTATYSPTRLAAQLIIDM